MKCKITRNAAKVIKRELDKEENKDKKLRVLVTHAHGDHAHYGLDLTHLRKATSSYRRIKRSTSFWRLDNLFWTASKSTIFIFPRKALSLRIHPKEITATTRILQNKEGNE